MTQPQGREGEFVAWTYPQGRSIALRAWELSACSRCDQVVDALELHRCAASRVRQVGRQQ